MGRALRPVDLARAAGISTQAVRNYTDAGVLPPAPRSPSGYRRFDELHRQALLTYRALARGYGTDRAQTVMRKVHDGEIADALALIDASHAAQHDQRRSLQEVGKALESVAREDPDEGSRGALQIGEVARLLGIRTSALRVWEAAGLLTPERERGTRYRRYRPTDVRDARMITMLRQGHYLFPQIRAVLDGLRETGSADALRAAIAQRGEALTARTTAMLDGAGRLHGYLGTIRMQEP